MFATCKLACAILVLFFITQVRCGDLAQEKKKPTLSPATDLRGQNNTVNCTGSSKRHFLHGECTDVTTGMQRNHQPNRIFHPHEPYINDATPIAPIHAMDSIPWIDDYQPIEPIQDDNEGTADENSYEDDEDRRNKIRKQSVSELSRDRSGRYRHGKKTSIGVKIVNDKKVTEAKIRRHGKLLARGRIQRKSVDVIRERTNMSLSRKTRFTPDNVLKMKRNAEVTNNFGRQRIFPFRLQNAFSNSFKRILAEKLKLFKLVPSKRGSIRGGLTTRSNKDDPTRNILQSHLFKISSADTSGLSTSNLMTLSLDGVRRGLVPVIPGKPKVEQISLSPLKNIQEPATVEKIPEVHEKMQAAKQLKKEDVKLEKLKGLDKVPNIKQHKQ